VGLAFSLLSFTTFTAQASLTAYTSGGQSVVYSSISNVTWTGDANLLGTLEASNPNLINTIISTIGSITDTPNAYDTPANSGSHTLSTADFGLGGLVSWFGAQAYTKYLNTINYAGSNQWALPSAGVNPQVGYNQIGSQFGQLYYNELNALAYPGTTGSNYGILGNGSYGVGLQTNLVPFSNIQAGIYWSGTENAANLSNAWLLDYSNGAQDQLGKSLLQYASRGFYAWAASPGQVAAVPVPGAVWLMGSALLGLLRLKRRGHAG
jgi:hypothetical protein